MVFIPAPDPKQRNQGPDGEKHNPLDCGIESGTYFPVEVKEDYGVKELLRIVLEAMPEELETSIDWKSVRAFRIGDPSKGPIEIEFGLLDREAWNDDGPVKMWLVPNPKLLQPKENQEEGLSRPHGDKRRLITAEIVRNQLPMGSDQIERSPEPITIVLRQRQALRSEYDISFRIEGEKVPEGIVDRTLQVLEHDKRAPDRDDVAGLTLRKKQAPVEQMMAAAWRNEETRPFSLGLQAVKDSVARRIQEEEQLELEAGTEPAIAEVRRLANSEGGDPRLAVTFDQPRLGADAQPVQETVSGRLTVEQHVLVFVIEG